MRVRIVPPEAASKIIAPPAPPPKAAVIPPPEPGKPVIHSNIPVIDSEIPPVPPLPKGGNMPPAPVPPATPVLPATQAPQAGQVPSAAPSGENAGSSPIPAAPSSIHPPQGGVLPGNRTALFDPKVIEQYGAAKKEDAPITLDIEQLKQISREREINATIRKVLTTWGENIQRYNLEHELTGSYYDLFIAFEIMADGSVANIRLTRTSGIPLLDKAALEAMRDTAQFPPLPKQWNGKSLPMQGHLGIINGAYYLR